MAGYSYGAWIDGAPLVVLLASLTAFIGLLAALLTVTSRRSAAPHGA